MSFLQPALLLALPLLAIPIIVHLIHLRRYQSVPWAAMQFLLVASRMSSGYSRLRQWVVLALRALAIAALIFFMARPLASGVSGWLASDVSQLQILVLDRSPSMQQSVTGQGVTKLQAVLENYAKWSKTVGTGATVVFTSGQEAPMEIANANELVRDPRLQGNSLTTNLPSLVEKACRYIDQKGAARATIWIASDRRESDWRSESGEWTSMRSAVQEGSAEVRFQVLETHSELSNLAIQLEEAKLISGDDGNELSLSCRVVAPELESGAAQAKQSIPLEIRVGDANTIVNLDLVSGVGELKDFRIPVDNAPGKSVGWGAIRIPPDSNGADNIAYFAFEPPVPRKTLIISEDVAKLEAISLAAAISPDSMVQQSVQTIEPSQMATAVWDDVVFIVWHGPLPQGDEGTLVERFIDRGGQVLFLPPEVPAQQKFLGLQWSGWVQADVTGEAGELGLRIGPWRNDTVLLGNTQNGSAVPLGDVTVSRYCKMETTATELARLQDGANWLVRLDSVSETSSGAAYAMGSTTLAGDSNLASNGIALYIMVQRMIHEGAEKLGRQPNRLVDSTSSAWSDSTEMVLGDENVLSNRFFEHAGVYRVDSNPFAQNRRREEDLQVRISDQDLERIFDGLVWYRVDATLAETGLVQEVWRWFAWFMLIALFAESILSLPAKRVQAIRRTEAFT
jgi:hypothetical protein